MLLFADSGASKTLWTITDNKGKTIERFKTIGLNPYFLSSEEIVAEIEKAFPEKLSSSQIEKLWFYGAGCGNHDNYGTLAETLDKCFPLSINQIDSDILGTARALFKNDEGIAAILGTGSNSCVYNSHKIYKKAISLGFILGDEGSGAYIGKLFVKKLLEKQFPEKLTKQIFNDLGVTQSQILENIYSKPRPNKFLADFCPYIGEIINEYEVRSIVKNAFDSFFDKYILIFPESKYLNVGFCGSVAYYFKDILLKSAESKNIRVSEIVKDPISGIIDFHKDNGFF